ncbi:MAG: sirohydrochlorin chelatase [Chloroflexi bacterium]|nr:sirohydrochlorin chelatase [Chloroflexota bacterium]
MSVALCERAVVLAAHGTRDPAGAAEARAFAAALAARLGPTLPLWPAFLELTDPPILDTLARLAEAGVRETVVLPLMLFGAGHVKNDVPAALAVARERHPTLTLRYGAPLGVQPELLRVLDERIAAVEEAVGPFPRERTGIVLVERGSSDPDANAQVYHLARMLWEGRAFGWVEPCFVGITRPTLQEGIARCVTLGAERVIVLPYFLFTGVLVRRIGEMVAEVMSGLPHVELLVADHLGAHPEILGLAERRIGEALAGSVAMRCDCCVYRTPLIGFEQMTGREQTSDPAHGLREGGAGLHDHHRARR